MKEVPIWHSKTQSLAALPSIVDLSDVERTDSSALAWLLTLQSRAQKEHTTIRFEHPPQALLTLAQLSGVQALLGWGKPTDAAGEQNADEITDD